MNDARRLGKRLCGKGFLDGKISVQALTGAGPSGLLEVQLYVGFPKRQTHREVGAQSHGSFSSSTALRLVSSKRF